MEGFLNLLDQAIQFISGHSAVVLMVLGGIIDMAMRLFKTEKPRSLLYAVKGFIKIAAAVVVKIAEFLNAIVDFLDKLLPQNVADKPLEPKQ